MANVTLFDQTGKQAGEVVLNDAIFGIEPVLAALSIDSKVLVILEEGNEFAALSARNLPNVKVATATTASVLDIANSDKLLVTQAAISKIEEVLA